MAENTSENTKEKLEEYQRKFRNLESDRKAYAEETLAVIKKQKGIIDKLKNENNQLKDVISKMNSQKLQGTATTYPKGPAQGEMNLEEIKQLIDEEQKMQIEIDKHVTDFQKKIIEKRSNTGGYNAGAENESSLAKQIKILENRLDKANQKFNEAIAINKQLRQSIDSLRRERVIFDNLYKKLEKELHEKRKQMANIIETANTAYEERDKANDQIQNLKDQAKRESADFEKDLRELSHIMEKNKKTLDYIKLTEKNRGDDKQMNSDGLDTDKLNKTKTQKLYKENKSANQAVIENVQKFEENFAKIQAATKQTDFEKLVNTFIQNEEQNFQMFKYVNELSNDIEDSEKQIQDLNNEIQQYTGPGNQMDNQNKKKLKDLEERLSRSEQKSEQFEFRFHESQKLIANLTQWIETLFNTIECDKSVAKELAGSQGISDGNMMIFLGIIEEKVTNIIQAFATIQQELSNKNFNSLINNTSLLSNTLLQNKQRNEMPTFEQDLEEEETEGDKILTIEDFRKKAMEKLENRKTQTGNKKKGLNKGKKK